MISAAVAEDVRHSWSHEGPSFRVDILCFALALAIHVPLYFMKIDAHKKSADRSTERLVSVDLIESMAPKPVEVAAPPAPPEPAKPNLMDRLKMLVKKEPPPPPVPAAPKPVEPPKLVDIPKPIELQAKLNTPDPAAAKLESKAGFKTAADPKLIENKQLALNAAPVGIAPLSAKKLGTIEDRSSIKQDRGAFQVNKNDQLSGIDDGKGPALAGANAAPAIAIRTGNTGSVEKFSAPVAQKSDKGRIGAVPAGALGGPELGLRDSIIARDAKPSQIGGVGAPPTSRASGLPVAAKQDAGRFQGGVPGSAGVSPGAPIGTIASAPLTAAPAKAKEKKSLFTITGPLKDRNIVKQVAPEYPAWAQAQGVEAAVVLEFTVDAAGHVKPNSIVVRRTSGYPRLDETAIQAIKQWIFVALDDVNRDEVGQITFNYSLS